MTTVKKAFTLAELLISLAVLAILWILAYITIQSYFSYARDSVRVSDINNIQKALDLYIVKTSQYPKPNNWKEITYSGAILWYQWVFSSHINKQIKGLNSVPVDPLYDKNYTYSVSENKTEYQLWSFLESQKLLWNKSPVLIHQTQAAYKKENLAYIGWNYNWLVSKTSTGGVSYILALPSIIANDTSNTDILSIVNKNALVYHAMEKLPENFSQYETHNTLRYSLDTGSLVVYSWSLKNLSDYTNQLNLLKNLKKVYQWSILNSKDALIKKITSMNYEEDSESNDIKALGCNIVNFKIKQFITCNDIDFITFYVINYLHIDISELPSSDINSVYQVTNGDIWFATNWAGVANYSNGEWFFYDTNNSDLLHNVVHAISQDSQGNIWFGTNNGVSQFNGENWSNYTTGNSELLHNHVWYIYTSTNGTIWLGTNKWVSNYNNEIWNDYTKKKVWISHNHVKAIYEDNIWNIWFGTHFWLDKYNQWDITPYTTDNSNLIDNRITYIIQDTQNNLWVGTQQWVSMYNYTDWHSYNTIGGLVWNNITYIYEDNIGNIWFGTDTWVSMFNGKNWIDYSVEDGNISGNNIYSIGQNDIWEILIISDGWIDQIQ